MYFVISYFTIMCAISSYRIYVQVYIIIKFTKELRENSVVHESEIIIFKFLHTCTCESVLLNVLEIVYFFYFFLSILYIFNVFFMMVTEITYDCCELIGIPVFTSTFTAD